MHHPWVTRTSGWAFSSHEILTVGPRRLRSLCRVAFLLCLAAALGRCGSDATQPAALDGVEMADLPAETGGPEAGAPDRAAPTADLETSGELPSADLPEIAPELIPEAGELPNPFGDWNQPCAGNDDCDSGFCVEVSEGKSVCTIECIEECPEDWECKGVGTGPDQVFICMPPEGVPCKPCETAKDCLVGGDLCVPVGETGTYCLVSCAEGEKCPKHYSCTGLQLPGMDDPVPLCYPDTESCVCTWELDGASEECSVSNAYGKCYGESVCDGPKGWSPCDAPEPAPETCDGTDEDCDGQMDEGMALLPCIVENEFGACKGVLACQGEAGMVCDAPTPLVETCNGKDENCDGLLDEGYPDADFDGHADCIDLDDDGDGTVDTADNCPALYNAGQADLDKDGKGDACDDDDDGDLAPDAADNCPLNANKGQADLDADGLGDVCDDDLDGDGTINLWDCSPADPDIFPGAEEVCDGMDNNCNLFVDEGYTDADGDKLADCSDPDDDNDGDPDATDCAPLDPTIGHGLAEECDGKDNDCTGKSDEGFPDTDGDGAADCVDKDSDGDGLPNFLDNCPYVANPKQANSDGDTLGDACDPDDDNDSILDDGDDSGVAGDAPCSGGEVAGCDDNCPTLPNQTQADADHDLLGNPCDPDADDDGFPNEVDCAPYDDTIFPAAAETCNAFDDNCNGLVDEGYQDTDGDKQANCVDADDDGDLDPDKFDCQPLDPAINHNALETCDGIDNNCDGQGDEGCPPAAVRLEQLQAVVHAEDAVMRVELMIGRPAVRELSSQEAGYKLLLGYGNIK